MLERMQNNGHVQNLVKWSLVWNYTQPGGQHKLGQMGHHKGVFGRDLTWLFNLRKEAHVLTNHLPLECSFVPSIVGPLRQTWLYFYEAHRQRTPWKHMFTWQRFRKSWILHERHTYESFTNLGPFLSLSDTTKRECLFESGRQYNKSGPIPWRLAASQYCLEFLVKSEVVGTEPVTTRPARYIIKYQT